MTKDIKGFQKGHIPWNKGIKKRRIKIRCKYCNKEIFVTESNIYRKYCSNKCKHASMKEVLKGKNKKQKILIICKICKNKFLVCPCDKDRKYCSRECMKNGLKNRITITCKNCNKKFEVWMSRKNSKFCSKKCESSFKVGINHHRYGICGKKNPLFGIPRTKEQKEKLRNANLGEKSHFWKGGTSLLSDMIKKLPKYKKWRQDVYERDNFTCQMPNCDKSEKYLNVHHIKMFSIIIKNNNILSTTNAIRCKELWNIDNGITLCKKCHKKIRGNEKQYIKLFINIINSKKI